MRPSLAFLAGGTLLAACASVDRRQLEIRRDAAKTYYDKGDLVRAEDRARQALQLEPGDLQSLAILGMTRLRASRPGDLLALNDAIATFERAEACGGSRTFQVQLGHGMARAARARELLRRAESMAPPASAPASSELAHSLEKLRSASRVDLEVAEDRLLAAHRSQPDYAEVLDELQALYSLRDEPERSLEWGRKVVALAQAAREERKKIIDRTGRNATVEDLARKDVRRYDIREANSRSLAGLMLYRLGRPAEAATELDRVLAIDAERIDDYYNRAVCRQAVNDFAGARKDLQTFLRRSTLPASSPTVRDAWDRINECDRRLGGEPATPVSSR
jgi:tetratricopeptide (TPR) repeat protein